MMTLGRYGKDWKGATKTGWTLAAPLVPLRPLGTGPSSTSVPSANRWCGCLPLKEDGVEETAEEQEGLYEEKIVHRLGGGDHWRAAVAGAVRWVEKRKRRYGKT